MFHFCLCNVCSDEVNCFWGFQYILKCENIRQEASIAKGNKTSSNQKIKDGRLQNAAEENDKRSSNLLVSQCCSLAGSSLFDILFISRLLLCLVTDNPQCPWRKRACRQMLTRCVCSSNCSRADSLWPSTFKTWHNLSKVLQFSLWQAADNLVFSMLLSTSRHICTCPACKAMISHGRTSRSNHSASFSCINIRSPPCRIVRPSVKNQIASIKL